MVIINLQQGVCSLDGHFTPTVAEWTRIMVLHEYDMAVRVNLDPMLPFTDFIWYCREGIEERLFLQICQVTAAVPFLKWGFIEFLQGKADCRFSFPKGMEHFLAEFRYDGCCYLADRAFY